MRNNKRVLPKINERLLYLNEVRVLDGDTNLGIMPAKKALSLAKSRDLDLLLVTENSNPPIVKIADYGKVKFQESKAKKPVEVKVKEVRFFSCIGPHDLEIKVKKVKELLQEGCKVRVSCVFKKKELQHPQIGMNKMLSVISQLEGYKSFPAPKLDGRMISVVFNP